MIISAGKEIYQYRELLLALTYRDIRVKYKQAVMGVMWVFFMPVLAITSGVLFRLAMAYFSGRDVVLADIVGVMVKSLPWLLFASIISASSNSLVGNKGLITKIYFPREVVPISSMMSALFDFSISITGLTLLLCAIQWSGFAGDRQIFVVSWALLWVPPLLLILVAMAAGLGLFLSCANLFLRDVKYIVSVVLQFGVFFSLVYFTYTELGSWGWMMLFNPVTPLLEGLRSTVVGGAMDPFLLPWIAYSVVVAITVVVVACYVFDHAEYLFAEYV